MHNSGFSSQKYEHVVVAVLQNPGSRLVEVLKCKEQALDPWLSC